MRKLTRYTFGQLFWTILAITLVLTCIVWLVQTLRYVELIANKGIPILLFLEMVGYLIPNIFVIIIPIAILIGVLFIYNKLIADHELVVMQGAGMSYWQLSKPVVLISLMFTFFLYGITLYFLPYSFRQHRDIVLTLKQESLLSLISVGQFNTFKKYTVYVHNKDSKGNFLGILLYNASQEDKPVIFMAEKGTLFTKDEDQGYLLLMNGSRQEKDATTGKPSILYFDQYVIETKEQAPEHQKNRSLKAHERNMEDLFNPKEPLPEVDVAQFIAVAHQRLIIPLYALAFGLLGVCAMILGPFTRKRRLGRILLVCVIATITEVGTMVLLHALIPLHLKVFLSYALVITPILSCLFLLSPGGLPLLQFFQRARLK